MSSVSSSFSVFSASILLTLFLCNFVNPGLCCLSVFKNAQNISFVQGDCAKSAGLAEAPSAEDLAKDSFNDKCHSKCVLNSFQMIDNEGQIDKDILLDFMEMNSPEAYLLKLSELATSCAETSGADKIEGGSKTGKSAKECKPIKNLYSCFLQGSEKLC